MEKINDNISIYNNVNSFNELINNFNSMVQGNTPTNMSVIDIIKQYNKEEIVAKITPESFKYLLIGIFFLIMIKNIYPKDEDGDITLIIGNYIILKYIPIFQNLRFNHGFDPCTGIRELLDAIGILYTRYYTMYNEEFRYIANKNSQEYNKKLETRLYENKIILYESGYLNLDLDADIIHNELKMNKRINMEGAIIKTTKYKQHAFMGFKCNDEYYEYDSNNHLRKKDWSSFENYKPKNIFMYIFTVND